MHRKQNEGRGGGLNLQEKIIVALSSNYQCHFISVYAKKCGEGLGGRGEGCSPQYSTVYLMFFLRLWAF